MTQEIRGSHSSKAHLCCVCGSSDIKIVLRGSQHRFEPSAFGSSRTVLSVGSVQRCRRCGFGFSADRPADEELGRLYRDLDIETYEAEAEGRLATARRHVKILERHVHKPGRILDVGCASGRFLALLKAVGWEVFGVEPSATLYQMATRLVGSKATIQQCTLQEAVVEPASFDAVTMWDVLEHVTDPVAFLRMAALQLKPAGTLLVNVPNLDSLQARLLGKRWPLILPEHLNYFNRSSLARAAKEAGLQPVEFKNRPVTFSVQYIFHRLRQHGAPAARLLDGFVSRGKAGGLLVPIYIGELCAAFRRI